jgi:hypothetical protein
MILMAERKVLQRLCCTLRCACWPMCNSIAEMVDDVYVPKEHALLEAPFGPITDGGNELIKHAIADFCSQQVVLELIWLVIPATRRRLRVIWLVMLGAQRRQWHQARRNSVQVVGVQTARLR